MDRCIAWRFLTRGIRVRPVHDPFYYRFLPDGDEFDGLDFVHDEGPLGAFTALPSSSDQALASHFLRGVENLRHLRMANRFGDSDMANVATLADLQTLALSESITDAGLRHIANHASLLTLDAGRSLLAGDAIDVLMSLTSLQTLALPASFSPAAVVRIASLPNLTQLDLSHTHCNAMELEALIDSKHLKSITLPKSLPPEDLSMLANNGLRSAQIEVVAESLFRVDSNDISEWIHKVNSYDLTDSHGLAVRFAKAIRDRSLLQLPEVKESAVSMVLKGAENDHLESQLFLAECHETGFGVEQDLIAALRWYEKAESQGSDQAAFKVAWLLSEKLERTTDDIRRAAKTYIRLADNGHKQSAFNLGVIYSRLRTDQLGNGVPDMDSPYALYPHERERKVAAWFEHAASLGDEQAGDHAREAAKSTVALQMLDAGLDDVPSLDDIVRDYPTNLVRYGEENEEHLIEDSYNDFSEYECDGCYPGDDGEYLNDHEVERQFAGIHERLIPLLIHLCLKSPADATDATERFLAGDVHVMSDICTSVAGSEVFHRSFFPFAPGRHFCLSSMFDDGTLLSIPCFPSDVAQQICESKTRWDQELYLEWIERHLDRFVRQAWDISSKSPVINLEKRCGVTRDAAKRITSVMEKTTDPHQFESVQHLPADTPDYEKMLTAINELFAGDGIADIQDNDTLVARYVDLGGAEKWTVAYLISKDQWRIARPVSVSGHDTLQVKSV